MTDNSIAASRTVRQIGPGVSCVSDTEIRPARLTNPTVGFIPTTPHSDAGLMIEPIASVPMAPATRFAETAAAGPELGPPVLRSSAYGFRESLARPLQPPADPRPRAFAHSLMFDLPRITHPASRSRSMM